MTAQAVAVETLRPRLADATRPLSAVPSQAVPTTAHYGVPAPQIGVTVLGSDALSREGVMRFLQECPDVQVVTDQAGTSDVVVIVIDRVTDATVRQLRTIHDEAGPRIVLVVGELDTARTADVMQAGAVGIIRRGDVSKTGLRRLIRSVMAGEAVVPPDVLTALLGRPAVGTHSHRLTVVGLNDREERVLRLLADGSDTREIGHKLCYSERTVKTIIQDITHRFGLRNRSHAVAYAIRQGLI